MLIYYDQNGLPKMQNERPMLASEEGNNLLKKLEHPSRLMAKYGYTFNEVRHNTLEQIAAAAEVTAGTCYTDNFKHKTWKLAVDSGASNLAAIVAATGSADTVKKALAVVEETVRREVIDVIFNPSNQTFAAARADMDPYCYDPSYALAYPATSSEQEVMQEEAAPAAPVLSAFEQFRERLVIAVSNDVFNAVLEEQGQQRPLTPSSP